MKPALRILKQAILTRSGPQLREVLQSSSRNVSAFRKQIASQIFVANMRRVHRRRLAAVRTKQHARVGFLVVDVATWKLDPVFKLMLSHKRFDPLIIVMPVTNRGVPYMNASLATGVREFEDKGYPVVAAQHPFSEVPGVALSDTELDLLFFTNPHRITTPECYEDAYTDFLSCYVPYTHSVSAYDGFLPEYGQEVHDAMWRIFAPHQTSLKLFERVSHARGRNVRVTGFPACEPLMDLQVSEGSPCVWKQTDSPALRIIWAPHHTIETPSQLPYSNFLRFCDFFASLAIQYRAQVQWAFKPHPLLRDKLERHVDWGTERTTRYFNFWRDGPNTQLEEGEYMDLFRQSDALIHDSASFLAEYLYTRKPVMFTSSRDDIEAFLNPFGQKAYRACRLGRTEDDVLCFVKQLLDGHDPGRDQREAFWWAELSPYTAWRPSMRIVNHLEHELFS